MRIAARIFFFVTLAQALQLLAFAQPAPNATTAPNGIKITNEALKQQPYVQQMIKEYNQIAARNPEICGDRKYFGIETVKVDDVPTARFYVDGKGAACIPPRLSPKEPWHVQRMWTNEDEADYRRFVQMIGIAVETGKCASVDSCMISSNNPLRTKTDQAAFHYSDCADFPYYLRAYFAFRKGLPFTYASVLRQRSLTPEDQKTYDATEKNIKELEDKLARFGKLSTEEDNKLKNLLKVRKLRNDIRYTMNGNFVAAREWVTAEEPVYFFPWIRRSQDYVSTATLRLWRNQGDVARNRQGEQFPEIDPDFYSPTLDLRGIQPGTVLYKTDGHTAVIHRVDQQTGKIHYIDAHPDNSISHGVIDETWIKGFASRANFGGGFKNWRPIVMEQQRRQQWWGGWGQAEPPKPRLMTDEELRGHFSDEQYRLFPDPKATVDYSYSSADGKTKVRAKVEYLEYLRLRMTGGKYRIDPVTQFKDDLTGVCRNIRFRREDVSKATDKGFHLTPHPEKLPDNIYGSEGDWERYSTPGRDVVFKQRVLNLVLTARKYKSMIEAKNPLLKAGLTVQSMKQELIAVFDQVANSCKVTYVDSRGAERSFNLVEAIKRAHLMSFDPYLCPERRFGATSPAELATCTDTPDKAEWYALQQFLRNRIEKTPNEPMGWSLQDLRSMPGAGTVDPKLVERLDVRRQIELL